MSRLNWAMKLILCIWVGIQISSLVIEFCPRNSLCQSYCLMLLLSPEWHDLLARFFLQNSWAWCWNQLNNFWSPMRSGILCGCLFKSSLFSFLCTVSRFKWSDETGLIITMWTGFVLNHPNCPGDWLLRREFFKTFFAIQRETGSSYQNLIHKKSLDAKKNNVNFLKVFW